MATTKKKTTTKRATTSPKSRTPKKTAAKKSQQQSRSFVLEPEKQPFMTFTPTKQSLYWLVLGVIVICFATWILKLQSDIQAIYDSIDANSDTTIMQPIKHDTKHSKH